MLLKDMRLTQNDVQNVYTVYIFNEAISLKNHWGSYCYMKVHPKHSAQSSTVTDKQVF